MKKLKEYLRLRLVKVLCKGTIFYLLFIILVDVMNRIIQRTKDPSLVQGFNIERDKTFGLVLSLSLSLSLSFFIARYTDLSNPY